MNATPGVRRPLWGLLLMSWVAACSTGASVVGGGGQDVPVTDLGLDAYLGHEPFRLSRGHRARLAIACGLAARPALLCLDDPFSPMDRRARMLTADALNRTADEDGLSILMASNNPLDALRYADRIVILGAGPAATIVDTIAHDPMPDAAEDDMTAHELHARLWRALDG